MQGHVGFDLEPIYQDRIVPHEGPVEDAIAAHDVDQPGVEQGIDGCLHDAIADAVQGPMVFLRIMAAGVPVADHHVGAVLEYRRDQVAHPVRRIGQVRIGQHIDVGVDIEERAAQGIAFSLTPLVDDVALATQFAKGLPRAFRRAIARIVINHEDGSFRQMLVKGSDRGADGQFFVIRRQDERNAQRILRHGRDHLDCFRHRNFPNLHIIALAVLIIEPPQRRRNSANVLMRLIRCASIRHS